MRIGHFVRGIFDPGGVATYIRQISAAQKQQGHEVIWLDVVARQEANIEREEQSASLPCLHYVRDDRRLFEVAAREVDMLHLHCEVAVPACLPLSAIRTVHVHHPYCPSGTRFLARSNRTCECQPGVGACLRGYLQDRCGSVRPAKILADFQRTRQELCALRRIPAICISNYMKQQMLSAGYPEAQLHVLHHSAPAGETGHDTPPPQEGATRFVFLGRLTALKGVGVLLEAFQKVTATACLDIAGVGPLETELREQAQQLGIAGRVYFHGWLSRERTRTLLREARALVFPSVWHEPAGLVTLEAAEVGRAVIGTRVGGLPEYALHNRNALIIAPGDVGALAEAMNRLASDWNLARQLGEEGRRLARDQFTLERHCTRLEALYASCRNTPNGSRGCQP